MSEDRPPALQTNRKLLEDEYRGFLDWVKTGDQAVLPVVREMLDEFPAMVDEYGDLTQLAQNAMLSRIAGDDRLMHEAGKRKLVVLADEVAGPNPTALERLLADQIVLCWQHLRYVEVQWAQARDYTFREGEYYQRCLDRAQRRYLNAIKTLAQVRKLGLPALQVNIAAEGGKQVNVA